MSVVNQAIVTSVDGTPIAYWRSGTGPPLVLVHGTTRDHTRWDPVLETLCQSFTCYAMDRRGRGGSGDAPAYSVEREFEDVAAVVDAIREPVHLLGHSYGALCALEAARLTPNIRTLVLYEPPVMRDTEGLPPGFVEELEGHLAAGRREEILLRFSQVALGRSDAELAQMQLDPNWSARVAAAHTVARETALEATYRFEPERFRALHVPVLLLQGTESPAFLQQSTAAVQAALPHSQLVFFYGHGHLAISTAPELFCAEVVRFITSQSE